MRTQHHLKKGPHSRSPDWVTWLAGAICTPVTALFGVADGQNTRRPLLFERQKAKVKSKKAPAAGYASAAAKALKSLEVVPTDVAPELEHGANLEGGNQNQNQNQNKKEKKPPAVAGALVAAVSVPAWIYPAGSAPPRNFSPEAILEPYATDLPSPGVGGVREWI